MSSIIFRRFKSKGPEFKGQKLASEKSRGTDKTLSLKRHITVINVYSLIFKIARYLIIITRYHSILLYFNVFIDALWYIYIALETDICDPPRHKYLNLPNLCNIILIR